MTAETLKPFITPQSVDNFTATQSSATRRQRCINFLAIGLSVLAIIFAMILLGFTLWHIKRVQALDTQVTNLNNIIESLQKRLGINYLDDLNEFEKEYNNALIDDTNIEVDADVDGDDDDYDEDDDNDNDLISEDAVANESEEMERYDDLVKKYNSYDDEDVIDEDDEDNSDDDDDDDADVNVSDNDNLYDDFEKFKDSKKKLENRRNIRSIAITSSGMGVNDESIEAKQNKTDHVVGRQHESSHKRPTTVGLDIPKIRGNHKHHIVAENLDGRRSSPLRRHSHRRRKIPVVKSGESSLLSAKSLPQIRSTNGPFTAAAHFHLNRKVPDRYAPINIDSYPGDMYIGQPSWTNELYTDNYFKVDNGILTIFEPGLYYIYAQVCYNNTHDQNGFVIFHGHKPFLQCLNTVPTNMPSKIHTCHTSGLINLKENETVHLRDFHTDRNVILKETNNRSYFGLIKV